MRSLLILVSAVFVSTALAQDVLPEVRVATASERVTHAEGCVRQAKTTTDEIAALLRAATSETDRRDLAQRADEAMTAMERCLASRPEVRVVAAERVVVASQPNVDGTFEVVARDIPAGRGAIRLVERVDGDGHADPAAVRAAFAAIGREIGGCLDQQRARGGEFELNVTFGRQGEVTQAETEGGSLEQTVRVCVLNGARRASIVTGISGSSVTYSGTVRVGR